MNFSRCGGEEYVAILCAKYVDLHTNLQVQFQTKPEFFANASSLELLFVWRTLKQKNGVTQIQIYVRKEIKPTFKTSGEKKRHK